MSDFVQAMIALRHWLERHNLGDNAVTIILQFEGSEARYEAEAALHYDASKELAFRSESPLNDKFAGISVEFENIP